MVHLFVVYGYQGAEEDAEQLKFTDKLHCVGSRRDFIVGCPDALAASTACKVTGRWFTHHFSVLASCSVEGWSADIACPEVCQLVWPACWIGTPDSPPLR